MKEALDLNQENGNTLWSDAIDRSEMPKIHATVMDHDGNASDLVGYQETTGHLVFDVKLGETFR